MRRLTLFFLVVGIAAAGDPLTFDYKAVSARSAVQLISVLSGEKILLDPEYHEAKLTLKQERVSLHDGLTMLAHSIGARLFHDGKAYHIVPKWKYDLLRTLHNGERVTLAFEKESARRILSVIATYSGTSMVMDPEFGDPKATFRIANVFVATALAKTLGENAGYDLRYGVVFVATKKRLAALPKRVRIKVPAQIRNKRFLLSFDSESASRVLAVVARQAGLALEIAKEIEPALGKRNVTLLLRRVRIEHVLAAVLTPAGAKAEIRDGKLIVSKR